MIGHQNARDQPVHDRQNRLVWSWGEVNGAYRGILWREPSDTSGMIERITKALKQADEGAVPYSKAALLLLVEELANRKESLRDR